MAAEDPGAAMQAQGQFSDMRKQAYDDLGREAGMFVALAQSDPASAPQAYSRLAQKAQAAGHPVPPTFDPKMLPMIEKLAMTIGGGQQQLSPRVIGNALVDPTGKVLYQGEVAPQKWAVVNVPDGHGGMIQMERNPATGEYRQPNYGGAPMQD